MRPVKAGRWPPPSAAAALTGHGVPLRFATKRSTARCGRAAISNRWFSANFGSLLTVSVSYIDPNHEVRQYRERMLELTSATLSAEKLALFEEELKSPCYEEVAVFQAFSRIVMGARKEWWLSILRLLVIRCCCWGAYHRQRSPATSDWSVFQICCAGSSVVR